jgi:hypothetical protein
MEPEDVSSVGVQVARPTLVLWRSVSGRRNMSVGRTAAEGRGVTARM